MGLENLSKLNRFPKVSDWVKADADGATLQFTETAPSAPIYGGRRVVSAYDSSVEAARRIALLPERASDITCFGVGDGVLIRQLLERPGTNKVRVVLLDPHLSFLLLSHFEHPWLDSPNIEITVASSIRRLPTDFVEVLGELHAAGDSAHHLRLEIYMYFFAFQSGAGSKFYAKGFRKRYDGTTRIQQVRPFIEKDGDVAQLFDKECGKTMIVVGAGPSVTLRSDALRRCRDEVRVVASLSALWPLAKEGFSADYCVALDPSPSLYNQFAGLEDSLKGTPLVYFPTVHSSVLAAWPGPRFAAYSETDMAFASLKDGLPRGELVTDSSVSISTASLALKLGAKRILLLGLDFAHVNGQSHGKGAQSVVEAPGFDPISCLDWRTESFRGERLATTPKLLIHCRAMETLIERAPDVEFKTLSDLGARIDGVGVVDEST